MKYIVKTVVLAGFFVATAWAGPVQKAQIDGDAKWLLNLDVDQFRASKSGSFIFDKILAPKIRQPLDKLKSRFKFDVDPNKIMEKINSITVYGTDYKSPKENAVLMIKTDADLQAAFVGVLAGLSLAGTNGPAQVNITQVGKVTVYSAKDQVYCAILPGKVVAFSASRRAAMKAAEVLDGKSANLASGHKFSEFPKEKTGFIFFAAAEGFNEDTALPPQAKLLQMADGGQVVLGEDGGQLFLNLALKGKTEEVVTQMQQVIQGLIAMSSLGQSENKDITQLIQAIRVSASDKVVSVRAEYPAEKFIQFVNERMAKDRQRREEYEAGIKPTTDDASRTTGKEIAVPQPAQP